MRRERLIQLVALCGCTMLLGAAPAHADKDDNPPGPRGGPGTNWENVPGVSGGPGASPELRFWSRAAWDRFCEEHPARCGERPDIRFEKRPDPLDVRGNSGARGEASAAEAGETSAATDRGARSATLPGQN